MFNLDEYRYDGSRAFNIATASTNAQQYKDQKRDFVSKTSETLLRLNELQSRLMSDSKESILICVQALDAAGKDSLIKHTLCELNPMALSIFTYRTPSLEESTHDFLWRYHKNLPARGRITVFNRSYYEEVLVVKVHEDFRTYNMPPRMLVNQNGDFDYIAKKYEDIKSWEDYLYRQGTRVLKIFLNVSKDMQRQRFLERIDRADKNYKFSPNDIKERPYFDAYQTAFQDAINSTSTKNSPWYVIPADDKWFTRFVFTQALEKLFQEINPQYIEIPPEVRNQFASCRESLMQQ